MPVANNRNLLIGAALATVLICLGIDSPAVADDCVQRFFNFQGLLQLPGAVLEDCMRTSYIQAIVTAVLGSVGGIWIARTLISQFGQPLSGPELPAVSRRAIIDLADKIEQAAEKSGYHEGVKERIDGALDEVQAEIDKLGRADSNSDEAKLLKTRLSALLWGLSQCLNENNTYKFDIASPSLPNSVSRYNAKDWKCNKFFADAYTHGAGVGLSLQRDQPGFPADQDGIYIWAPKANEIAKLNSNLRSFTNARDYNPAGTPNADSRSIPRPGDGVAFPMPVVKPPARRESGHITIYLGNGLVLGAKELEGATIETLEAEKIGHQDTARVRQYTGSGR